MVHPDPDLLVTLHTKQRSLRGAGTLFLRDTERGPESTAGNGRAVRRRAAKHPKPGAGRAFSHEPRVAF